MYNINKLYYTDKKQEMIAIGQAFAEGYDATWLKEIKDALKVVWTKKEKENNGKALFSSYLSPHIQFILFFCH